MEEKDNDRKTPPPQDEHEECEDPKSKELPHGEEEPPGPRGNCEKESTVQGSE